MRKIACTRHSYVLCKDLTGGVACNDKNIGKPNGSESRIYLRCTASNPKALLTAYSDYQKCLWGSARLNGCRDSRNVGTLMQKSALHFFKNIISKMIFFIKKLCSDFVKALAPRS